jgi:hypothetical protein
MTEDAPLPEKVAHSFQQLKAVAGQLNAASGDLGKPIAALEEALKRLNLGVPAWVKIRGDNDQHGNYDYLDLGYAKVGSTWGIALRERYGNEYLEGESGETWLFANAPRVYRIAAVDKLPDLLAQLTEDARETTERLREKIAKAQEIASAFGEARVTGGAQARTLEGVTASDAARALARAQRR